MYSYNELTHWLDDGVTALVSIILAGVSWFLQRQVKRTDLHETRLTSLETQKAGHADLEAAIERMESAHQRVADSTNLRLDRIYEILLNYRNAP